MKPITEKQIVAIRRMTRAAKVELKNVEQMSSFEASKVIEGLLQKLNATKTPKRDYSSDALAGLAVKILAQRSEVDDIVEDAGAFKKRAASLYKVFLSARQVCLA